MYQQILLCYDGTNEGRRALRRGAEVAIAMKSHTYLLAICRNMIGTSIPEGVTQELARCESEAAAALLAEGVQWLKDNGVCGEGSLVYGDPLVNIPLTADRIHADLVVVGYRGLSRRARWWSESDEVTLLSKLPCSMLIAEATSAQ